MASFPPTEVRARVVARIHERVPDVTVVEVEREVVAAFDELSDSRVKDFLPILVEREVVVRLQALRRPAAS